MNQLYKGERCISGRIYLDGVSYTFFGKYCHGQNSNRTISRTVVLASTGVSPQTTSISLSFVPTSSTVSLVIGASTPPFKWVLKKYCKCKKIQVEESHIVRICDDIGDKYRYGFNGQEKDNEIKGIGNSLDFGARIYDSRVGRWLSLDPLAAKYPSMSPYNFVGGNPIKFIDPDGNKITNKAPVGSDEHIQIAFSLAILKIVNRTKYDEMEASKFDYQISFDDLNKEKSGNITHFGKTTGDYYLHGGLQEKYIEGEVSLTRNRTLEEQDVLREKEGGLEQIDKDKNRISTDLDEVIKMNLVKMDEIVEIKLDKQLIGDNKKTKKERTVVLGHELFGHAYYNTANPATAWYYDMIEVEKGQSGQHSDGHPSGNASEDAETEVKDNYDEAVKQYNSN